MLGWDAFPEALRRAMHYDLNASSEPTLAWRWFNLKP